jgi:hypothetical protein
MTKSKNRISLILMLVIAISFSAIRLSNPPRNIITYDYYGSYLYLPALFIYNDIGIKNIEVYDSLNNIYSNTPLFYQLSPGPDGNRVIRFFAGMSYMFAPGFFAGHIIAHLTDYPADGFSLPYQRALLVSGMIISLLGLYFSRKILLRFFNDTITTISLILIFIGSNLVFFYTYGNDAPHLYLFSLFSVFLWLTIRWHDQPSKGKAVLLGLVSGLIIASRPSEMILLIIPFAWGVYNLENPEGKNQVVYISLQTSADCCRRCDPAYSPTDHLLESCNRQLFLFSIRRSCFNLTAFQPPVYQYTFWIPERLVYLCAHDDSYFARIVLHVQEISRLCVAHNHLCIIKHLSDCFIYQSNKFWLARVYSVLCHADSANGFLCGFCDHKKKIIKVSDFRVSVTSDAASPF